MRRLVLALALLTGLPACRVTPLYQPPAVSYARHDLATVEAAITRSLTRRGWIATRSGPSSITGTLHVRSHTAVVRIDYTTTSFTIQYVSSENLKYKRKSDGSEEIHANYNAWVDNLIRDISTELGVGASAGDAG